VLFNLYSHRKVIDERSNNVLYVIQTCGIFFKQKTAYDILMFIDRCENGRPCSEHQVRYGYIQRSSKACEFGTARLVDMYIYFEHGVLRADVRTRFRQRCRQSGGGREVSELMTPECDIRFPISRCQPSNK